jgi:UDP-4-amino-4,6-dideoxy-N-acetyl-beta-L-altrosamine N-acetyltransferase
MLKRQNCRLRTIQEDDLPFVLYWRNSERIRKNMYSDHMISMDQHREWFRRIMIDKSTVCKIFEYEGQPLGVVNFTDFDNKNDRCSWGIYIGESNAPKKSGMAMGYLALQYIFETLNIRKLCAEVFAFNNKSTNYHRKLGFSEEGRFLKHVYKDGVYHDIITFAHFQNRWIEIKDELLIQCFI